MCHASEEADLNTTDMSDLYETTHRSIIDGLHALWVTLSLPGLERSAEPCADRSNVLSDVTEEVVWNRSF